MKVLRGMSEQLGPFMRKRLILYLIAGAVVAYVALTFVIGPNYVRRRTSAAECARHLGAVAGAKGVWADQHQKTTNDTPTLEDLKRYILLDKDGNIPGCPAGGAYTLGRVGETPRCSIGGEHRCLP